jgi:ABC-type multidrug transport system fused ATPase/permease subunit
VVDLVALVGLVVAFVEYVNKFVIPVRDFSAKYTLMQSAMASAERIVALLDTEEVDAPERKPAAVESVNADATAAIEFDLASGNCGRVAAASSSILGGSSCVLGRTARSAPQHHP